MTENRIQKAANHKVMILGCPWIVAFLIGFYSFVIGFYWHWYAGVILLVGPWIIVLTILKTEPRPVRAFFLWWSVGRFAWDSGNRHFLNTRLNWWQSLLWNTRRRFSLRVTS